MAVKHYPSLSSIISIQNIPGDFDFLENEATDFINKVHYRNYIVESSPSGDVVFYGLEIISKEFKISILGSELQLVFFKNTIAGQSASALSVIPIGVEWRWPIKKYVSGFKQNHFSYVPEAFVDVLLELTGLKDEKAFLEKIATIFLTNNQSLLNTIHSEIIANINDYKTQNTSLTQEFDSILSNLTTVKSEIDVLVNTMSIITIIKFYENNLIIKTAVDNIRNTLSTINESQEIDINLFKEIIYAALKDINGINEKITQLLLLFQTWLGDISKEDIIELLIPRFNIELRDINMSLEFPRKWLLPLDTNGNIIDDDSTIPEDQKQKSELSFNVGSLGYSTTTGFHFKGENSFHFNKSQVGKTGLTIEFSDMKLDLSRKTNIPEASADGRPEDFIGVYAKEAIISLPEKWFKQDSGATIGIFGRDLLIGTGGISGIIGLGAVRTEVATLNDEMTLDNNDLINFIKQGSTVQVGDGVKYKVDGKPLSDGQYILKNNFGEINIKGGKLNNFLPPDTELVFTLGKKDNSGIRKGFKLGFSEFTMKFQQNALLGSSIKGSLTIPKYKHCDSNGTLINDPLKIDIEAFFENSGDFRISAKIDKGLSFCLEKVFIVTLTDLDVGKDDDKAFLSVIGQISFANNDVLSKFIQSPIEIKKLCIYSDGSFEFEGGSIPLPGSIHMKLGPVDVSVTNMTFGSEERDGRKYKYFGFDCGLGVGSAGLDLRGDGITYYFTTDGGAFDHFIRIAGIGIDLVIPGTASKENAALIIEGYLSLKEAEYRGSIAFSLPKAGIAGGASMAMQPKVPAWVIDAHLDFSVPIPLAQTNLGIYGFRGLFGMRYIAAKQAIGLSDDDPWFEYYKKDVDPDHKGMHIGKMLVPQNTGSSKKPFSIGAGLSIADVSSGGKTFSLQAFLLISTPELIYIEGKANILGDRVGLTGDEPPFFAFVAFSIGKSVELGMGADYKLQKDDGKLIDLHAEVQAAFFFKNKSAWYVNFGEKDKPITARILDLFNAYSYLMLSASGIEAGAGVEFGFDKEYWPVKISVEVYLDIWGKISFARPQISAGISLGGHVDVSVFGIGLYLSIATVLEGTVPKPFYIHGSVDVCVSVKLLIKKFEKCFTVDFIWLKNPDANTIPIYPLPALIENGGIIPVSAFHIGSGRTYPINYFGDIEQVDASNISEVIPLDSYIDLQFDKAVDANLVSDQIAFVTNAPVGNIENIPPKVAYNQVQHSYFLKEVALKVWNNALHSWFDYHPYSALPHSAVIGVLSSAIDALKIGAFQKTGDEYNKISFLSQSPFKYLDSSAGSFTPEQMGITPSKLFCQGKRRKWHCTRWTDILTYPKTVFHHHQDLTFIIWDQDGQVVSFNNLYQIPESLMIPKGARIEITLPEPSIAIRLKMFTYSSAATIRFIQLDRSSDLNIRYNEVLTLHKNRSELFQVQEYYDENVPVGKIVIEPATADLDLIHNLQVEIDAYQQMIYEGEEGISIKELEAKIQRLNLQIEAEMSIGCVNDGVSDRDMESLREELAAYQAAYEKCLESIPGLKELAAQACQNCQDLKHLIKECLVNLQGASMTLSLGKCLKEFLISNPAYIDKKLLRQLSVLFEKMHGCGSETLKEIHIVFGALNTQLEECQAICQKAQKALSDELAKCQRLEDEINRILSYLTNNSGEEGYDRPDDKGHCGTFIHEVCWMTETDYLYNKTIPGQAAINENYMLAQAAIENVIQPIWRPEESYMIHVKVADLVNNIPNDQDIYFGFKTKGPIGHYPENEIAELEKYKQPPGTTSPPLNPNYDNKIEVPETSLKFYIDNERSYPDPNGTILNRKPLFYKDPRLLLYFNRPYAKLFFDKWDAYQGLPQRNGYMEILIKDPVEDMADSQNDHSASLFTIPPETTITWHKDTDPIVPVGIEVLSNLHEPEINNPDYPNPHCWTSGGKPLKPAAMSMEITAKKLKPLKLYTAIIKNNFEGDSKEVHRYGFQTSRYGDLKEQINSYHLKDTNGNNRDAVFTLEIDLRKFNIGAQANINRAFEIVFGTPTNANKNLAKIYADPFQRLMEGHFEMEPLHAALNTEFDFIKERNTQKTIGLLIRNPEPFNDPKISLDILEDSIKVIENGYVSNRYYRLFSKDRSQVFLMKSSKNITAANVKIRFAYLEWDGYQYIPQNVEITDNIIL